MTGAHNETTFDRAGQIIAASWAAAFVGRVCRVSLAAVRASRSFAAVQRGVTAYRRTAISERGGCLVIAIATAVAGHVAMASMLPAAGRPTVTLTALLLVAVCLAAAAGELARGSRPVRRARHR
jgi:hypothetical protein